MCVSKLSRTQINEQQLTSALRHLRATEEVMTMIMQDRECFCDDKFACGKITTKSHQTHKRWRSVTVLNIF